jgi:hypothetical protein
MEINQTSNNSFSQPASISPSPYENNAKIKEIIASLTSLNSELKEVLLNTKNLNSRGPARIMDDASSIAETARAVNRIVQVKEEKENKTVEQQITAIKKMASDHLKLGFLGEPSAGVDTAIEDMLKNVSSPSHFEQIINLARGLYYENGQRCNAIAYIVNRLASLDRIDNIIDLIGEINCQYTVDIDGGDIVKHLLSFERIKEARAMAEKMEDDYSDEYYGSNALAAIAKKLVSLGRINEALTVTLNMDHDLLDDPGNPTISTQNYIAAKLSTPEHFTHTLNFIMQEITHVGVKSKFIMAVEKNPAAHKYLKAEHLIARDKEDDTNKLTDKELRDMMNSIRSQGGQTQNGVSDSSPMKRNRIGE